ncbi:hypothetical protein [Bradyrhizobium ottawaense]|uniref:Uncharacterized protein n=1 Tax=Bradyrhizobium ottawaense TaxID=931866 RepID=A0A2U8PGC3_9BRAD|nr:hypothetical protein [Bradyrhizobium ottawaense]AWL96825.1 hypothetical protein CIT37_35375 [Bradyrhizobium ottawaense]MBR1326044.1 hypothetical protein [Bradyrhizobium ottawaense]
MSVLRDLVLDAHGVTRWKSTRTIEGYASITGMQWARKGWPDALKQVHVTADTGALRVSNQRFTNPDWRSVYHPEAVAIETSNGKPIKSRANPRAAFEGLTVGTAWDDLHLVYFSGYAIRNYLNSPFLFQLPGFKTEEIEPGDEPSGRRWWLKVTFPGGVATHCPEQMFHVDGDGLISRVDYGAVVTGRIPMAHYMSEYRDFDGVRIATKRRAYHQRADGTAITEAVVAAIDIADIRLS